MNSWTTRRVASAAHGVLHGPDLPITGVSTDTRSIGRGQVFAALRGPSFDGHEFMDKAFALGAVACLMAADCDRVVDDGRAYIEVQDTLTSLGDVAAAWLADLPAERIALTGSNGKTSTKEFVGTALSPHGAVHKTAKNHNNLVGVPQTAFGVTVAHRFGVFELGMSVPGEIARLTEIVKPRVALVTSVAPAHLEGVGSLDGVVFEKSRLFAGLTKADVAVVNGFDARVKTMETAARRVVVGPESGADVVVSRVRRDGVAGFSADVTVAGKHHTLGLRTLARHDVVNAALALGVVHALGLDVGASIDALQKQEGVSGRMRWVVSKDGVNIIDDTYNANPGSMRAALQALGEVGMASRKIAILGDMRELGAEAARLHAEIGRVAADVEVDALYAVGRHADDYATGFDGGKIVCGDDVPEILPHLSKQLRRGDWVLVKGSRGMRMERVVQALLGETA